MLRFSLFMLFLVVVVQFGNCEDGTDYDNVRSAPGSDNTRLSVSDTVVERSEPSKEYNVIQRSVRLVSKSVDNTFGRKSNRSLDLDDIIFEFFVTDNPDDTAIPNIIIHPEIFPRKPTVVINVQGGRLLGTVEKGYRGSYIAFKGIPYAKPPLDDLRFKDPVPAEPWLGDRDASKYGNVCVQHDLFTNAVIGDEDCLYLNVYTTDIKPAKKRAVMVYIHGGVFVIGDGGNSYYGPDYLVSKEVVLVTLNYRLGVLGFLNLNDTVATGNQGLKDMIMALRWVRSNVMQFGGDPENITIFGNSAGGAAVLLLALSPNAEGLFHKAISQSGPTLSQVWTEQTNSTTNAGFQLAAKLGNQTSDSQAAYEFLKTIDARKLVEVQHRSFYMDDYQKLSLAFTPSMDSESSNPLFPEPIENYLRRGVRVPFMLGITSDEGILFVNSSRAGYITQDILDKINTDFKNIVNPATLSEIAAIPMTVEELRSLYFGNKSVSKETLLNLADLFSDADIIRGTMKIADYQAKLKSATYLYQFSYISERPTIMRKKNGVTLPGVGHAEEISFLFSSSLMNKFRVAPPVPGSKDYKMIEYITSLWTNFAKTGNPTPAITEITPVIWTPLKSGNTYDYLDINHDTQMKIFRKGKERWDWGTRKNTLHT